jgi:tRNA pseudouridine38-40 synthase
VAIHLTVLTTKRKMDCFAALATTRSLHTPMPRYKLTIEYDGTPFCGWQKQHEGLTVQGVMEEAAAKFLGTGAPVEIQCAGRTDAGVHARGQVAHMDLPVARDVFNIRQGLNMLMLPHPVSVISAEEVPDEFHARFDGKTRHYLYRITNRSSRLALDATRSWQLHGEMNLENMCEGAAFLIGNHDFTSFRSTDCQSKSPIKTLDTLEILQRKNAPEQIMIRVSAKSFLHHQVRNMVGTLAQVALGKWTPDRVKEALDARDRRAGGLMAPAHGLYLMKVEY